MAKADKGPNERNCGTMEVHERLLRTVPGYAEARVPSENVASGRRDAGVIGARRGHRASRSSCTSSTRPNEQNISDAQIAEPDRRPQPRLPQDQRRRRQRARPCSRRSSRTRGSSSSWRPTTRAATRPTASPARRPPSTAFTRRRRGQVRRERRRRRLAEPTSTSTSGCARSAAACSATRSSPAAPPATDGVVILHTAFGTTGTAAAPFDLGRTATHEVGHWLNLRHIWGDDGDGCSGTDFVDDTPNQARPQLRHADLPARHLRQRAERRHVHELHGLHRRRRHVHVHRRAGRAHAGLPRRRPRTHRPRQARPG